MSKIIMCATPYCYGPTTKLLCVARCIKEMRPEAQLVYLGNTPGIDLAESSVFAERITITNRDAWNENAIRCLSGSNLLVSFLEYRAIPIAKTQGIPSLFVDTLAWSRKSPPPYTDLSIEYAYQRFFMPLKEPQAWGSVLLHEMGAILPDSLASNEKPIAQTSAGRHRLLVNLGGLQSPAMVKDADTLYVDWVVKLLKSVDLNQWDVTLTLPKYLKNLPACRESNIKVLHLNYTEFIWELEQCTVLLTVPGLETILEAMSAKKPIVLLPPHNSSQVAQSRIYSKLQIPIGNISQDRCRKDEHEHGDELTTAIVQQENASNFTRKSYLESLREKLTESLGFALANQKQIHEHVINANDILKQIGTNGARDLASRITTLLEQ